MYRLKCLLLNLIYNVVVIGKRKDIKELLMLLYDVYTCVGEGIINLWLIVSIYNYYFYGTGADTALETLETWLTLSFIVVCIVVCIVKLNHYMF